MKPRTDPFRYDARRAETAQADGPASACPEFRRGAPAPMPFHLQAALLADSQKPGTPPEADLTMGLLNGIDAWRCHPYRRPAQHWPTIWNRGSVALRDCAPEQPTGPTVLVVPSLINSGDILDITPDRSLVLALRNAGLRPVLLDWQEPTSAEADLSARCYVTERLVPAIQTLHAAGRRPLHGLGYCMGGTLLLGALAALPQSIDRLCLLGTPWAFEEIGTTGLAKSLRLIPSAQARAAIRALQQTFGFLPAEIFQTLFATLSPHQAATKFTAFAALDQRSTDAERFVAIEDWLNSGPPITGPVAEELLVDWCLEARPNRDRWHVGGGPVRLQDIPNETLVLSGSKDVIAPPAATAPLGARLPNAESDVVPFGHVGMLTSAEASQVVTERILRHFAERPL